MIQSLSIQNLALIESATLEFDDSLNVISGETGAGKSILLDGLSFIFGGRADKSLIRTGATSMKVEAVFVDILEADRLKDKYDIDASDGLHISRELDINGKNTCRINGNLYPVSMIKSICSELVDIHGQSEHLSILDNAYQLHIIDLFDKENILKLESLGELIDKVNAINSEIESLGGDKQSKQNLIDLYSYQKNEIEQADIKENEYEELLNEKRTMQQFEKINNILETSRSALEDDGVGGDSALTRLNYVGKILPQLSTFGSRFEEIAQRLDAVRIEAQDIADTLKELLDSNTFDEARFNYIDTRLDELKTLFRKYGEGYDGVKEYYNQIVLKLDNLINSEARYNELEAEKDIILAQIDTIQDEISVRRKESASVLLDKMQQELKALSMPNARLNAKFTTITDRYSHTGRDMVEFYFSANAGFEPKPLNKVVSGGEMSRVMLAYKIVTSEVDKIDTIVFDEIDTGLSGEVAATVALYLIRLSKYKQIIAVSHLPQICAAADRNIKAEKYSDNNSTYSKARTLSEEETYLEIGRLMGDDASNSLDSGRRLKEKFVDHKNTIKNKI